MSLVHPLESIFGISTATVEGSISIEEGTKALHNLLPFLFLLQFELDQVDY